MRAVDTNLVVRFLLGDQPAQAKRAREVIRGGSIFVPITVLLETEWVLRSVYRLRPSDIHAALSAFSRLDSVEIENKASIEIALKSMSTGLDFADALHLACSAKAEVFLTFDVDLIKAAARLPGPDVRAP